MNIKQRLYSIINLSKEESFVEHPHRKELFTIVKEILGYDDNDKENLDDAIIRWTSLYYSVEQTSKDFTSIYDDNICSICLNSIDKKDNIKTCCNNHIFHEECMAKYIHFNYKQNKKLESKCPTCRCDIDYNYGCELILI